MDAEQFATYTNGLAQIENDNRNARQQAGARKVREKAREILSRQTTVCDGSATTAVRIWVKELELAMRQVGQGDVIEIIARTVTGPLRWEVERFVDQYMVAQNVLREAVPWAEIRDHIGAAFLNIDEASALRDDLEKVRQSAYETEAGYSRRYREVADAAYPSAQRNADQQRILIRAYAKGLQSNELARKLMEEGNPPDLEAAITHIAQYSARKDAYVRLGRQEEPMEVGALTFRPTQPREIAVARISELTESVRKLLQSQEKLQTKVAKIEVQLKDGKPSTMPRPNQRQAAPGRPPAWDERGNPRCFICNEFGHMARGCPKPKAPGNL